MLSLTTAFWGLVVLFAVAGMMRGWTREIVVTASIILALFAINQLMSPIFGLLNWDNNAVQPDNIRRYQFFIMSSFLLLLAFAGYQGPTLASSRVGDRLNRRDNLQDKLLGLSVGAINGWLIIGSLWSFLEYKIIAANTWLRFPPNIGYPFDVSRITRPAPELAPIIDNLPIPFLTQSPYILLLLLILFVLFLLIVLL
ncbi:MAG TPA: CvpA family protein [Promineifilum sp.]|nr:CvpA family protein [Promineifilum sp.]HRO89876.1 CvpA family protein [Promineifilum sp.]HRQ14093.1 CvpA family protein [Promineifilum sp.]